MCTNPSKPNISKLKTSKKTITVSWKKLDATGYELQRCQKKGFKKKVKKMKLSKKATSKKMKKLSKGKRYYFRIRAYKTIDGKKYYSPWSKVKSIKCK
ncbi:MAG: fibronectin type III domain-containing protein [Eubacterium sp.]|nr:fibronectin type III domain-containing protein [Eubacterium sp.]